MFFVLSSGRSGSNTAADTFNQFTNCVCPHHPEPELVLEATGYFYGEHPGEAIARVLRDTRKPIVDGKIYGEANLQLSLIVPVLEEVFPGCQYIWLLRDGRDFVASTFYRGWYDPASTHLGKWEQARLQGDKTGDFSPALWQNMTPFERCCWLWTRFNRIIEERLTVLGPSRWRKVYLETMKAALPEVATFLKLEAPRGVLVGKHNIAKQPVVYWESWSPEQRGHFERLCGKTMDAWYPQWRSPEGKWLRIASEKPDKPSPMAKLTGKLGRGTRRGVKYVGSRVLSPIAQAAKSLRRRQRPAPD